MMRIVILAAVAAGLWLGAAAMADPAQTVLDDLVIYMPYDEGDGTNTTDLSGNGYDGKLFCQMYNAADESTVAQWGQPINNDFWVQGKWGFAIDFKKGLFEQERSTPENIQTIEKYIIDTHIIGDGIWSDPNARDWTFSCWVKRPVNRLTNEPSYWVNTWALDAIETTITTDPNCVDWWSWGGGLLTPEFEGKYGGQYQIPANQKYEIRYHSHSDPERFIMGSALGTPGGNGNGQWQNILITVAGEPNTPVGSDYLRHTGIVYVNGTAVSKVTDTGGGPGWLDCEAFMVGVTTLKGDECEDHVDDVAAWNRILTPEEIAWIQANPIKPTDIQIPANAVEVSDENLVARYHFEEGPGATTTADLATAFPAANATAQNGAAIVFDSSPLSLYQPTLQVGNIFDANQLDPVTGTYFAASGAKFNDPNVYVNGFTLSGYVKPNDAHNNWGVIATKGGYDGMIIFYLENGGLHSLIQAQYTDEFGVNQLQQRGDSADGVVAVGVWSHVAVVWDPNSTDASEMKFYVNGKPAITGGVPVITPAGTVLRDPFPAEPFMIGNPYAQVTLPDEDLNYRPFRGGIDDVRLYNRPLTSNEVLGLYFRWCNLEGDLTDNCFVDMDDIDELSAGWQSPYTITDLEKVANDWLESGYFPAY